ncbi:MAG: hypothetical protein RAM36_06460, partial [Arsenophonus sp.]|nr:hypothetical protein [Arsenophonus sp.]
MEKIKQNGEIKKVFYEFLEQVLTTYGKKDVLYYLVENSPGLLVFSDRDRGPVTGIDKAINSIDPENTPVAVISIFTGECLHYPSFRDFKRAITANKKLKSWVEFHFDNYGELKLIRENEDFSFLFESIIEFNIKKADILIKSHTEAMLIELFSRLADSAFPYTFYSLLTGNITGVVYGSILAATPSFLKASISDVEDEYRNYIKEGLINIVAEILGTIAPEAVGKFLSKSVNLYSKYKLKRRVINYNKNNMREIIQNFQKNDSNMKITLTPDKIENRILLEIQEKFNPNNLTVDIPAEKYLTELQLDPYIAKKINDTITEDDSSIAAIEKSMRDHEMSK